MSAGELHGLTRWVALACGLVLGTPPAAAASIRAVDDMGRSVELAHPARRIVTLAPFLTELAFSAGAGDRVVGVSAHSDYPPRARQLPQVASAASFSIEEALALRPDLVLAWGDTFREEDVERLERLGVAVFVTRARNLDDAARLLEAIGRLSGTPAGDEAARYRRSLEVLRAAYSGRRAMRVFVEIWHRPLTTVAGRHWINEALELCGARNVFASLPTVAPLVDWERVYASRPEAVVGAGAPGGEGAFRARWAGHTALRAVAEGALVYVDADTLHRPTLRLATGVRQLCEGLDAVRTGVPRSP